MKRLILTLIVFIQITGHAQEVKATETNSEIKENQVAHHIGDFTKSGVIWSSIDKTGDHYIINYKDIQDTRNIEDRKFTVTEYELDQIYKSILYGFITFPVEDLKVELEDTYVFFHFERDVFKKTFRFIQAEYKTPAGMSKNMTKEQIDKLFGKE